MTGNHPPQGSSRTHGMLDDEYWSSFTSDFADYELGGPIGFGASSTVYAASFRFHSSQESAPTASSSSSRKPALSISIPGPNGHSQSGPSFEEERECAIKISSSHPDLTQLFRESRLLGLSRHPNVLRVLATFTLPPDHRRVAIVTPLITGGSLAGILEWRTRLSGAPKSHGRFTSLKLGKRRVDEEVEECGRLDEEEIKAVTKQVLDGLCYLHVHGFLHRDLKAGNILVAHDGTILLADFGVGGDTNAALTPTIATRGPPGIEELNFKTNSPSTYRPALAPRMNDPEEFGKRKSFVGTPSWMAPEVVMGQKYDSKADIWSLGITLLELAHGSAPRSRDKTNDILRSTVMEAAPTLDRAVGGFSKTMKEFIDLCLAKDPSARPTSAQMLEHPWLKNAKKRTFVAESLLAEMPALEARQELRRVPTMSSLASRASSWDFSLAPSLPASPIRTAWLTPGKSTPTSAYFPDLPPFPSRSHSRQSSKIPSLPPSPRVPLKQWAERSASEMGSDAGSKRQSVHEHLYLPRQGSRTLRRDQSMSSFDDGHRNHSPSPLIGTVRMRPPSADGGMTMSPVIEASQGPGAQNPSHEQPIERLVLSSTTNLQGLQLSTSPDSTTVNTSLSSETTANNLPSKVSPPVLSRSDTGISQAKKDKNEMIRPAAMGRERSGTVVTLGKSPPLSRSETNTSKGDGVQGKRGWRLGRRDSQKEEGDKTRSKWSVGGGLTKKLVGKKEQ